MYVNRKDKKMCLVQMSSLEEAVHALIALHDEHFPGTDSTLRISFAKTSIWSWTSAVLYPP